jgi:hypothetical protein
VLNGPPISSAFRTKKTETVIKRYRKLTKNSKEGNSEIKKWRDKKNNKNGA